MPPPQPIDLGYIMGGMGTEGPPGRPPTQEEIMEAILNTGVDSVPIEGSNKLMTSGGIFNAINEIKPPTIEHLSHSTSIILGTADFGTERYIGNSGFEENKLSLVFPATATNGSTIYVEFRSEGSQDIKAVIESLEVEEGGRLLKIGELNPNSYITRIRGSFAFGVWLVQIDVFEANETIPETKFAYIFYSGENYAYFSSLCNAVKETEVVGGEATKLIPATSLKPGDDSEWFFGNLYNMTFKGWKTNPNGTNVDYTDLAEVTIPEGETLILYPVYEALEKHYNIQDGDYGNFSGYAKVSIEGQVNKTVQKNLVLPANNSLIAKYKELKIKLKVTGRTDASNDADTSLYVNNLLLARHGKGRSSLNTTDWIDVTRTSERDGFAVQIKAESVKKFSAWAVISAIRIE